LTETKINEFAAVYDDINSDALKLAVERLRRSIQVSAPDSESEQRNKELNFDRYYVLTLMQWIVKWVLMEMLPNITVLLRIFMTMCVFVASCQQGNSKQKLVKNYLHLQMSDVHLSGLAVLLTERELA